MNKIRMVDLKTQYDRIKDEIDAAINDVIDSTAFIRGRQLKEFEDSLGKYLGVNHVIGCGNGTDALQISLMSLNLEPDDEIITSDFTFIATVEVIALLGLKPVLVDVDPDTYNLNPELVKKAITPRTKAIIPVHLFGQCAPMDELLDIAGEHGLYVIEDTAQATGATYYSREGASHRAGTMGIIGCTSFFPSKNLGCYGDGGAVFTNDAGLAEKVRVIGNHGMKTRYHYDFIGVNSRLDTIQAAVLQVKLRYLDEFNRARQSVADAYNKAFNEISRIMIPEKADYTSHIYHQYTIRLKETDRNKMQEYLNSKDIPSMVYYPVPLHRQKAFGYLGYHNNQFPVSEELCQTVLSLPVHTEMEQDQLQHIIHHVKEFLTR